MKRTTIITAGVILTAAVLTAAALFVFADDRSTDSVSQTSEDHYTCPMHPSVHSDRPGACPVCGMALVRKSSQADAGQGIEHLSAITLSSTQRVMANISTRPVRRGVLEKPVSAVGVVSAAEPLQATVAARFRGRIERLSVNVTGERVTKGGSLFELYSPDLISAQQEYLIALEGSSSSGPAADMRGRMIQTARERLLVHFGLTEEQVGLLERTRTTQSTAVFHSPISGTVVQKLVTPGQYVDEGMVLYQLADLSTVWVYLDIYESDLRFISLGQKVLVTMAAYPGEEFPGHIRFIDPVLNPETRTVRVRTELRNPDGRLKPNMYVQARIVVPVRNTLLVPSASVLSTGKRTVVWVEKGPNTYEPRPVSVGASNDSLTQILGGLAEGERVAATGGYLIDSESLLRLPAVGGGQPAHPGGHGAGSEAPSGTKEHIHSEGNGVREMRILVKGGYVPDVLHIKKGMPARLVFYRDEDSPCTDEVVIKDLGIRRRLASQDTTVVEIAPQHSGEISFSCGMNMLHGTIVVHD